MEHYRNLTRYGREWDYVFDTTTYEVAHAVKNTSAEHKAKHEGVWSCGSLETVDRCVDAMLQGASIPVLPLSLPLNLTSHSLPRQTMVRRPCGPLWSPALLLQNHPRPAYNFHKVNDGRRRIAKLAVSCWTSGALSDVQYARRGQAIAALLAALKRADYEIEAQLLYIGHASDSLSQARVEAYGLHPAITGIHTANRRSRRRGGEGDSILIHMPVHTPGRVLDLKRIATIFGHEGVIRGVLFPWREMTFGVEQFSPADESAVEAHFHSQGWLYVNNTYSGGTLEPWNSDEGAREWIRAQLTTFGIHHK